MPPAPTATLRQQRLGAELRKLRERAGLTSTAAAALLGGPQARISNIEAGRYAVSADRVRTLARNYSCADETYVDALATMTGGRKRGWWEEYRDILSPGLLDLAELEHHATALRVAVTVHMPGLLQTPEHARATMREAVPPLRPHEIEHRVSYRVKRQAVLFEDTLTPHAATIHEAALRMGFGGPDVTRAQLDHLLEMSEQANITIRVLPFGQTGFPASGQPITYAVGQVPQLDTVVLDTDHGCEFLDAEAQLNRYRSVLDRMESRALPEPKSRDLIQGIAREM
ncbi:MULTISPECIES: helix-turn-helix transcriptional regulator [unclassified Streptomyces]|uniref:helix-turn-helix domain-containing protein n=1 Tax=unclassified Streptomyces TaxID=2593676 RepID=UPI0023667055|nr:MULTISPECIES: helix-turn-helix transcriptional regulator [unclassified Streptomyces]MDF3140654.1 helix-turn-helix transcriptional regulator [Streptomyces sp. T21Q-yed]WDF38492.1 helix-turn-helix transcriptional regulator [Streptomyces sp. T12]